MFTKFVNIGIMYYLCAMTQRIPTHPGDVVKEEIESRGISQKKFAELLSVPYTQLNEILNGKRPVSSDFALMVEAALGFIYSKLCLAKTDMRLSAYRTAH